MRPLKLDFVPRPSPLRWIGAALLVSALATAAYLAMSYVEQSAELERWEDKYSRLQKTQRTRSNLGEAAESQHLQEEIKTANRVIARLSLPWDALFREIDASVDKHVTLLSIEPDAEKQDLRITGEARDLVVMLEYVRRLQSVTLLKDVHLISHQVQQQDPQKPVRFVIYAQWVAWAP